MRLWEARDFSRARLHTNITITAPSSGLIANNAVKIKNAKITISAEDDGIHANNVLSISGGKITISKSCEGLEGKQILISGGEISVVASDDGMNAAGDTQGNQRDSFAATADALISISDGTISVNSDGDGIDSNGSLEISGDSIIVEGPENDGNGALDYNGSGKISGGEIITIGSSGMAQSLTGENQNVLAISLDAAQSGNKLTIKDSQNNTIKEIETSKKYSTIVFSSPELKENEAYTIFIDDKEVQKVDSGNYSNLKGNGVGGQRPGGRFDNNGDMEPPQKRF